MSRFLHLLSFVLALMTVNLTASAQETGPFGIAIGQSVKSLNCKPRDQLSYFDCVVPKPHSAFESYIVQATEGQGVCWIKAIGKDISDNGYGTSTRSRLEDIRDQISSVYGDSYELTDILMPGSIWDDGDDWMMGLRLKDRFYAYMWSGDLIRNLTDIALSANATSSNTGYVALEFYGNNMDACNAEASEAESDAF